VSDAQPSLPFGGVGPSHRNAPETSHQAALANAPRAFSQWKRVLLLLDHHWQGLTDDEIAKYTGLVGNSVRPRRRKLFQDGLIEDSGNRRSSWMGNPAVVWRITDDGARVARELAG
jgi:predicted ArsR family transcriptional regulator